MTSHKAAKNQKRVPYTGTYFLMSDWSHYFYPWCVTKAIYLSTIHDSLSAKWTQKPLFTAGWLVNEGLSVLAGGNSAIYSQLLAAFSTLDFPVNLLVGRETQSLLPTAFIVLPVTANHFDRAG